jgi:hypothetical protein
MGLDHEIYFWAAEDMATCGGNMSTMYAIERTVGYGNNPKPYIEEFKKVFKINSILDQEREHGAIALLLMAEIVK